MGVWDWFVAGVAGYLGVIFAPFLLVAVIIVLAVAALLLFAVWRWFKDFCRTAVEFFWFCIGRDPW